MKLGSNVKSIEIVDARIEFFQKVVNVGDYAIMTIRGLASAVLTPGNYALTSSNFLLSGPPGDE